MTTQTKPIYKYLNPNHILYTHKGTLQARLAAYKRLKATYPNLQKPGRVTGPYQFRQEAASDEPFFCYLVSDFSPGLRWDWCDEIDRMIDHTGYFTDEDRYDETVRGVVMTLPHSSNTGHLIGWSMGKGRATEISRTRYDDMTSAARAADELAEEVAERERINNRLSWLTHQQEEARNSLTENRAAFHGLAQEYRQTKPEGAIARAVLHTLRRYRRNVAECVREIKNCEEEMETLSYLL